MATYEELIAKSRELAASGDMESAKRVAQIAVKRRDQKPEKSWATTIKENVMGDNDPTTQNFGEKLGTFLNKAGESMTFGLVGDEADAAMAAAIPGGMGYDERLAQNRQQEALLEKTNPGAALTADIGGAVMGAALPMGAIGTLGRGAGLMPRIAASTAAGAGMGATHGFMEGEGAQNRLDQGKTGAKIGAVAGALAPAVGAGVQKLADSHALSRAIKQASLGAPTSAQKAAAGRAAYQEVDDAGVQIKPEAFSGARQRIVDALRTKTGFDELPGPGSLTPNSARVMQIMGQADDKLANTPTSALPFNSLDQMRRQAGAAAGNFANKTDQKAGMEVIRGLDDFVARLSPDDVAAGDVDALKTAIPKARSIWRDMTRSQKVDDAIEAGGDYLSGASSGIRNQFKKLLKDPSFSDAEKTAIRKVINGSAPEQLLNLLGGGLGQLMQVGGGAAIGGVPGAMIGAAGAAAARKGSEAITRKNAEIVRALMANGGLNQLPVAGDNARKLTEALLRRNSAAVPQ